MKNATQAKLIYVPVLTKNGLIVEYDHDYDHRTFKGCQKLCDLRNTNSFYSSKGQVWKVAKYGRPKLVEEFGGGEM